MFINILKLLGLGTWILSLHATLDIGPFSPYYDKCLPPLSAPRTNLYISSHLVVGIKSNLLITYHISNYIINRCYPYIYSQLSIIILSLQVLAHVHLSIHIFVANLHIFAANIHIFAANILYMLSYRCPIFQFI